MRKFNFLFLLIMILLVYSIPTGLYAQEKWYYFLPDNQQYETDFELEAGGSKEVVIHSDKKILVGFWTNTPEITDEQVEKYSNKFPIMMKRVGKEKEIRSLFGSSLFCAPEDDKINIVLSNESQESFKIVIYTQILSDKAITNLENFLKSK